MLAALLLLLLTAPPSAAFAQPNANARMSSSTNASATIAQITDAGQLHDGSYVTFTGEVVGDILMADAGHRWLLLQDGEATISVYVDETDAAKVTHLGRYGQVGTRLEISGIFEVDCAQHDGLIDMHAAAVKVIDEGHDVSSSFNVRALQVGGLLVVVGIGLLLLQWRLRERTR
jgi:uncharacterized protein YdeI (BOF family)